MAKENELAKLKSELRTEREQESEVREAAGALTLEGKQVEILTVGPRAPASMLLSARAARRRIVLAESDPTDPVVAFDRGPNDPVTIYW
jgi:hypothetical protein